MKLSNLLLLSIAIELFIIMLILTTLLMPIPSNYTKIPEKSTTSIMYNQDSSIMYVGNKIIKLKGSE